MGGEQYITPAIKLRLHNRSHESQHSVQAMSVFRRKGEENLTWGSAFEQVVSRTAPLEPGQSVQVTLKSDARYHSQGSVDGMFAHAQYRDALVEIFPPRGLQRMGRASARSRSSGGLARVRWRRSPASSRRRRRPRPPPPSLRPPLRLHVLTDVNRVGFTHVSGPRAGETTWLPRLPATIGSDPGRGRPGAGHRRAPCRGVRARRDGGAARQRLRGGNLPRGPAGPGDRPARGRRHRAGSERSAPAVRARRAGRARAHASDPARRPRRAASPRTRLPYPDPAPDGPEQPGLPADGGGGGDRGGGAPGLDLATRTAASRRSS